MPMVLRGLRHPHATGETRGKSLDLPEAHFQAGTSRRSGRPGMDLWKVLVPGVLREGLSRDFDRLHSPANGFREVRGMMGHGSPFDGTCHGYQRIVDSVPLPSPELLGEVGRLVVESGHAVAGKGLAGDCAGAVIRLLSRPMFITRRM